MKILLAVIAAAFVSFADDRGERLGEAWAELFVVGDVEPGVEGLVRESAVAVVGVLVGVVCVGEQPQGVVEERTPSRVVLVMLGQAAVDVREPGPDDILF